MQAALPSTYDFLKLADPVALFDSVDIGLDGAAIRRAIDMAIKRIPEDAEQPRARRRKRVLAEAGRILLSDPERRAEVIHLSYVAAPDLADTTPLASLRLRALWGGGDREGTIAEADRLMSLESGEPAGRLVLRNLLRKWNIEKKITPHWMHLRDYWPHPEAAIRDPFTFEDAAGPFPLIDRIGGTIALLNKCSPQSEDAFLERMQWGAELHRRMLYLKKMTARVLAKREASRSPDEETILEIFQAVHSRISPPDLSPLTESIASGRSVVLAHAHAGLSTIYDIKKHLPEVPHSLVSRAAARAKRPEDYNLSAQGPNVALEFAKLAKLTRKSPRLVRIFPDGQYGELIEITVCGFPVKIGRGAIALAYLGKAKTYFTRSVRTDEGFTFTLLPGPDAALFEDRGAFEEAFGAFYASCLEEIVLGAPEDMVLKGGFWPELR